MSQTEKGKAVTMQRKILFIILAKSLSFKSKCNFSKRYRFPFFFYNNFIQMIHYSLIIIFTKSGEQIMLIILYQRIFFTSVF